MDSKPKTIFGIDLGTTYSCISYVDDYGQAVVVNNSEGNSTTPSVVYVESEGNVVVGDDAKDATKTSPARVAALFKRVMGEEEWRFRVDSLELRPQELSRYVLQKLAKDAEIIAGVKVEDVVITCPAYFGIGQKEATRQAGELAGLNVRAVIQEPVAAAIAYGLRADRDEVMLVYDLGGGTFDLTLIDIKKTALTELTTGGDARLGGSDWDVELARFMAGKVSEQVGQSVDTITADQEFYAELLLDAEKLKRKLTNVEKAKHSISYGGERTVLEITREDFDRITQTLLERTITLTKDVLETATKEGHPAPTRMCLVGGSSFMPQVKRRLSEEFPSLEIQLEDPNQIVAKGAAQFGFNTMMKDQVIAILEKTTGRKVEDIADAKPAELEKASQQVAMQYGLANGRTYTYQLRATYRHPATNVSIPGDSITVTLTPQDAPDPVNDLSLTVNGAVVLVHWSAPRVGRVVLRGMDREPEAFKPGNELDAAKIAMVGTPINSPSANTAQVDVPKAGRLVVVPFTVSGSVAVVGTWQQISSLPDVTHLQARVAQIGKVDLQWDWPTGVQQTVVTLYSDEKGASRIRSQAVTKASYLQVGGFAEVEYGATPPMLIRVQTVSSCETFKSSGATTFLQVGGRGTVRYRVENGEVTQILRRLMGTTFGRLTETLTKIGKPDTQPRKPRFPAMVIESDQCDRLRDLVLVGLPNRLPLSIDDGETILDVKEVVLEKGRADIPLDEIKVSRELYIKAFVRRPELQPRVQLQPAPKEQLLLRPR